MDGATVADTDADGDAGGEEAGDVLADEDAPADADAEGGPADADGDADGDMAGGEVSTEEDDGGTDGESDDADATRPVATVQVKLTDAAAPPGYVPVTVTTYWPEAPVGILPLISPPLVIDSPGGRSEAVNSGACPAAVLSDLTCS